MRLTISKFVGDVHKTVTIDEFGEKLDTSRIKDILIAVEEAGRPALPPADKVTAP